MYGVSVCMSVCLYVWMYGCMDVWLYGCMDVCMDVWMDAYNYIFYHLIKVSIASHHRLNNPILSQRNFKKYQPTQPIAGSNRAASKFDTRAHGRARMAAAAAMMSDPFEKTNLLDKCGFLYPNFDRKKNTSWQNPVLIG